MPLITPPRDWAGLDDGEARNNRPPDAMLVRLAADGTNHVAAHGHRVLLAQSVPDGTTPTTTVNPFHRLFYRRGYRNGAFLYVNCAFLPLASEPATTPRLLLGSAGLDLRHVDTGTIQAPDDLLYAGFRASVNTELGDPTVSSRQLVEIGETDGFRARALAVWEAVGDEDVLNSDRGASVLPGYFAAGSPVRQSHLDALYQAQYRIWSRQRKTHGAWAAWAFTTAAAITTSSTSFLNLMDLASTSPYADNDPAIICPAQYSALAAPAAQTIAFTAEFWAAVDDGAGGAPASTARLQVESLRAPASSSTITVAGATPARYTATVGLTIRADSTYDKVALFGRVVNGADRLLVWAWSVYEEV